MVSVIKNGKLILPDRIVEDHYLIIEGGIIKKIAPEYDPAGNEEWIDAEHQYVSPGFFDTHIHGAGHAVWEMPDAEAFRGICSRL